MSSADASLVSLNRLVSKLDHTLLSSASEERLRRSQYERNRVGANIEYARSLLLLCEKQSATMRVLSQRQQTQATLQAQREAIKRLSARLQELNQLGQAEERMDGVNEAAVEGSTPAKQDTGDGSDLTESNARSSTSTTTQPNEVRSRRPLTASGSHTAASTSAREQLFADRPKEDTSSSSSSLQHTETIMSHHRGEQEILKSSLVRLATHLKQNALQFSSSLQTDKDVLQRAEGGLDKSAQGMEAAERRMGMLRRMTEGQGWWGRLKMYALIGCLWLGAFLLVFVVPKLRL